jgi:hypothetical protein
MRSFSCRSNTQAMKRSEMLFRFFASTDDGFPGDVYLHEARRGHPILVVHLKRAEQMEQLRDLLTPYHAHHIKYIGTWTVTDLPSSSGSHGAESRSVPHGMKYSGRGELVGTLSGAVGLAGRHPVAAQPVGAW